ncbi:MAG: pyridoxamine 5'-phosphate oxidase family protein [Ktedonobacterales bacterium]
MNWKTFQETAPELASLAEERFARSSVALLGTLHKDGSPRISPVEPLLAEGELLLGMMWHSTKALDLLRDPRCTLHTVITSLEGTEGECKLNGQAREASDAVVHSQHQDAVRQHWAEHAPARFHVFALEVEHAAFITYEPARGEMRVQRWDPLRGLRESRQPYP